MSRFLLDTNIVSKVTKPEPSPKLVDWMARQDDDSLFISSLTLAEISRGILMKPAGARRRELGNLKTGAVILSTGSTRVQFHFN